MTAGAQLQVEAGDRYLILLDISGYTGFLSGVERAHGEDFSGGLPAGYRVLGELIQGLIDGLQPRFELVKVEGDAVFGSAPADALDGRGQVVLEHLGATYRSFTALRDRLSVTARDDRCTECFAVATLDLKAVLHRGFVVRQALGGSADLTGPAVNVAHRLLKNTVRERIGARPYVLVTQAGADKLAIPEVGLAHRESYPDVGAVEARVVDLAEAAGVALTTWNAPLPGAGSWPEILPASS